jgi:hypothetical protein
VINIEELELYNNKEQQRDTRDKEAKRIKFCLIEPLGQMYNIVIYICSSTAQIAEFLKLASRMILLDNCTRWNSWDLMLAIALELQPAIEKYCQNYKSELEDDKLTPEDWRQLCTIKDFLEPFQLATLYTKGDCAAIDQVLFTMDVLIKHLQLSLISKIPS